MTASTAFFLLLVLACPLMMMLMMRGGHGHGSGSAGPHGGHGHEAEPRELSTDDLRQQRAELGRLIEERERDERPEREPTANRGAR
jgi:hypothetical protein